MKTTLTLFLLVLLISIHTQAQSKIAVQNGGTPKFYTVLTDAVTNAVSGDTIYIPGGTFTAGFTLTKKLHFVGVGHHIDSTLVTGITKFIGNVTLSTGSDNSSMEGIYVDGNINFGATTPTVVSGFFMRRCNVGPIYFITDTADTQIRYANNLFIESVIRGGISGSGGYNFMQVQSNTFSNNIINGLIHYLGNNCIFKNNVLILGGLQYVKGAVFENNYIVNPSSSFISSIHSCTFRNNLNQTSMLSLNSGYGNLFTNNIDTQSLTATFVNYTTTAAYSYAFDYHLKATSPGKNKGTDGTDIGVYGGAFPWKEGGVPSYPHFQSATIAPQTDNTGKLNVKIKVAAQDN